jgi:regulator of sigma E protease
LNSLLAFQPDSIFLIGQKLWWFLIVLGVLVTFHEFGHFIVARWAGVRVLKFSIGFGPKLFGWQKGETEYIVAAIPLGGYVKMFGEDLNETISPEDQECSFVHKPLSKRSLIVAAGPGFNFILSYLIFTIWLASGTPLFVPTYQDLSPTIEAIRPESPAALSGLQVGDRITQINEKDISTQSELFTVISESEGKQLTIDLVRNDIRKTFFVTPEILKPNGKPVYALGIEETPAVVTSVIQDSPAMKGGLLAGDRIIQIEGSSIHTWRQMTEIVQKHPNKVLAMEIRRDGRRQQLSITPESHQSTNADGTSIEIGKIGIIGPGRSAVTAPNLLTAPIKGLEATWGWIELTVLGISKMFTGEISPKNIGGPIMIASISGQAAEQGIGNLAFLVAILSINLGILNLLPIPILDGGHLLFFAFEAILRRPLGEKQREFAQQVGLVLLVGIMVFAFWNDIERLLQ